MTDHSWTDAVVSGACYVVSSVNDRSPMSLDDFVAHEELAVTAAAGNRSVTIRGCARHDGDGVVLYEKDADGRGKDVRTWRVAHRDGQFEAVERSNF
jgi:hypothetical protein